jgi:amidase
MDHLGPIARSVRDCAQLLQVIVGPDGLDHRQRFPDNWKPPNYTEHLTEDCNLKNIRIGILKEGFKTQYSQSEVDEAVQIAAERLRKAGAEIRLVSVPLHSKGGSIWSGIGFEGALECMIRGASAPSNVPGASVNGGTFFPTSMIDAYGRGFAANASDLSPTLKMMILIGEYLRTKYHGRFYAKAQNLRSSLRQAYDHYLVHEGFHALILPTTPYSAPKLPTEPKIDLPNYIS